MAFAIAKTKHEPLFHVTRRQDVSLSTKWIIRIVAILVGFVLCGLVSMSMGSSFTSFFEKMFNASFNWINKKGAWSFTKLWDLLERTSILLLIAVALTPAFKMRFWNIGGEGQVMMGILMCAVCQKYIGPVMAEGSGSLRFLFFVVMIIMCMAAGAIWGLIPAFFKAKFNTNETLFTLMLNYVATFLTTITITSWDPIKSSPDFFSINTYFPKIGGIQTIINLIIVVVVFIFIVIYLRFTKHGYELSVVGESVNTAKYVGINVNKVIMRTMVLSGAICGLCGALLLAGEHNSISKDIVAGRGFTGVMIAWLGGFNPLEMLLYAFLCAFIMKGASSVNMADTFPNIMVATFFFVMIACEFFINYNIRSQKLRKLLGPPINWCSRHIKKPINKLFGKKNKEEE